MVTSFTIKYTPTAYLLDHEADLKQAFRVKMKVRDIYDALKATDHPPPMSYRQFCRLTADWRQDTGFGSKVDSTESSRQPAKTSPQTPILIPGFQLNRPSD